jgi:hypothetical protein
LLAPVTLGGEGRAALPRHTHSRIHLSDWPVGCVTDTTDTTRLLKTAQGEEEEEEDLFAFNDTIEGPKAPAADSGTVNTSMSRVPQQTL